ncbi:MAG TPA: sulfatase-like hydrolase/transferase [Thermoanaerobaculia bacterium]|nr:sulfatase-like hydrolase/transferase [Thermoanaerobaculia bacterium]
MRRIFLLAFILLTAAACRGRFVSAPSNKTPVILISIDTLRSDHLPAYGYKGVATPNIDALRADSILYERAYSHVPLTLPSHTSILTGMLPADNGVHDNIGFTVSKSTPMIQELLKQNGYVTGAAVSAFVLRKETGISRGFDFYDDEVEPLGDDRMIGRVQRDGNITRAALEKWIDANSDKPFFAFLHLYEPHTPYTPPEPYYSRYPLHYDGEIAYVDSIVGSFIAGLKQKGIYDKALIILLSDHGEGLGEHGEDEHAIFVYREVLQVPLIVKLPHEAKAGATVNTPVELVDIFPTILDRTATAAPKSGHRVGQSLLTFLDGGPQRPIYSESYYARYHFGWSDLHSLIDGNDHYIKAPQPELYDLASDPKELHNSLQENRRAYVRLRDAIEPYIRETAAPSAVDPEEAAKLAALGYVGSTAQTKPGQVLPDPKASMGTYHDIRQAFTWYRNGKEDDALRLTNQLLTSNAQMSDLWDLKFKILDKVGRKREAIDAAKEGLRQVNEGALLLDVAKGALDIGDLDDAQKHAELAIASLPSKAHEILAYVWAKRGNIARAEEEAKLSLKNANDPTPPLMQLATIEKDRGNLQQALGYLDRAVQREGGDITKSHEGLHALRGDVLARLGRNAEAEKEFRTEIEHFPASTSAYSSLILLLGSEQRFDEGTKLVFDLIKAAPTAKSYLTVSETLKAMGDDRGAMYWAYQGLQKYPHDSDLRALARKIGVPMPG